MAVLAQKLSPTESTLLKILSDGKPHTMRELLRHMPDELTDRRTVRKHLSRLRKKIEPTHEIVCILGKNRFIHYRMMRPVTNG